MKIQDWLKTASNELVKVGIDSARLDSSLLLEDILNKPRDWVISHDNDELSNEQIEILNKNLLQRKSHIPLAYIVGSKEFYGRNFLVTEDVLIPRPESEAMIELLLRHSSLEVESRKTNADANLLVPLVKSEDDKSKVILDIGTGSGILAITAQLELPEMVVVATDISKNALAVAKQNAARLEAPVQFYEANLLDIPPAIKPDVILANLPYVPNDLITSDEITKEPSQALFSGQDGLDHYRVFWSQVITLPYKPQIIITESLENQHPHLAQLATTAGYRLETTATLAQLFVRSE